MKKTPVIALALAALAIPAAAAPSGFGMIGLAPGETLRINAANAHLPPLRGEAPPDPCRVQLSFVDGTGQLLLPAVQLVLPAGQSTHYDLNGDLLFPTTANLPAVQRMEVRPVLLILPNTRTANSIARLPPDPCVSSVEILDNTTGKALVNSGPQNPGEIVGFNPQPDPPGDIAGFNPQPDPPGDAVGFNPQPDPPGIVFGQIAIVAGQTLRLNAVNVLDPGTTFEPPDPCRVTIVLFGPDGAVLANTVQTLNPSQAASLDYTLPTTVADVDSTAAVGGEVRGLVTIQRIGRGAFPPDPCRASLEVFDNATGRTTAMSQPQLAVGL